MKKIVLLTFSFVLGAFICWLILKPGSTKRVTNAPIIGPDSVSTTSDTSTSHLVSIDTAVAAIKRYKEFHPTAQVQAFTISYWDVINAIGIGGDSCAFPALRAYIGVSRFPALGNFHLYIVPVGTNELDSIPSNRTFSGGYAYDLIAPCPNTCDTSSILYKAFH